MRQLAVWTLLLFGSACRPAGPVPTHVGITLPPSAKLVHHAYRAFGPDGTHLFVFEVTDGQLLELLKAQRPLQAAEEPTTSIDANPPPWWPEPDRLTEMELKFEFFDEQNTDFWSVWTSRAGPRLYLEIADW